jgi:hypothetical protein
MVSGLDQHTIMGVKEVSTAHEAVLGRGVMFGEVIGQIVRPPPPVDNKLVLADAVVEPV